MKDWQALAAQLRVDSIRCCGPVIRGVGWQRR
jgi:hypothetical protein